MAPKGSRFVWHELDTTDVKGSVAWYRSVVGWKDHPSDMPDYPVLGDGKTMMAGVMALPQQARDMGAQPSWLSYVSVDNVDNTVRQAEGLGAQTFVPPTDIPKVGRFAVLADPQGAVFAVFTPLPMPGAGPAETAELYDWSWHELACNDWDKAWRFYQTLFGWEESSRMDMGEHGVYFMFKRAGSPAPMGGIFTKSAEMTHPNAWLPYVRVPDADAVAGRVKAKAGKVMMGPMEIPGGDRVTVCVDPWGAGFAVHAIAADLKHAAARRAEKTAKKPAATKPSAKKPAKKAAKKAVKKAARKTVKKGAKKATKTKRKNVAKQTARKAVKKRK